jgi:HSP20 family protein
LLQASRSHLGAACVDPPDGSEAGADIHLAGPIRRSRRIGIVKTARWAAMPTHSGSVEDHVTLMRFDPFRDFDRLMDQNLGGGTRTPRTMPLTATRRGDTFLVDLDVPGVRRDDVDLTVERNVVTVRATRSPERQEGDEVIIDERPYGQFERQLFLGDNLDPSRLSADMQNGTLRLTIPVSEESKPRRIPLGSDSSAERSDERSDDRAKAQAAGANR